MTSQHNAAQQHIEDHGLLRFLTCGSVDDGKSTLIGRLLFDTKAILVDTLTNLERWFLEGCNLEAYALHQGGFDYYLAHEILITTHYLLAANHIAIRMNWRK